MMSINILAVGKIKEKFFSDAIAEYAKRLARFAKFSITEIDEELLTKDGKDRVRKREGERIIAKAKGHVALLDISGKIISSEELADNIKTLALAGKSEITFVIGGSYGVSDDVRKFADERISFGRITYPHQFMRVILTEQIYRAFMINSGSEYHK
jgi:23S rRNA (pseudouridine1915-N3)-methyltransferase